jgi:hypothetical protein
MVRLATYAHRGDDHALLNAETLQRRMSLQSQVCLAPVWARKFGSWSLQDQKCIADPTTAAHVEFENSFLMPIDLQVKADPDTT